MLTYGYVFSLLAFVKWVQLLRKAHFNKKLSEICYLPKLGDNSMRIQGLRSSGISKDYEKPKKYAIFS